MALTITPILITVFGNKRAVLAEITFDDNYATGGESLTPANLGLQAIDAMFVDAGAAAAGTAAVTVKYDRTNKKLQAFGAGAGAAHTHTGPAHTHSTTVSGDAETAVSTSAGTGASGSTAAAAGAGPHAQIASTGDLSLLKVIVLAIGA